jgi:fructose-1,6-bisphosphatase/inositol monophosphatase family enzyme
MGGRDRKVSDYGHLLDLAQRAATLAAAHVQSVERPDSSSWQLKGQSDFVTRVDRETEALIGETLLAETPDATILGEELTPDSRHEGLVWVVDPPTSCTAIPPTV